MTQQLRKRIPSRQLGEGDDDSIFDLSDDDDDADDLSDDDGEPLQAVPPVPSSVAPPPPVAAPTQVKAPIAAPATAAAAVGRGAGRGFMGAPLNKPTPTRAAPPPPTSIVSPRGRGGGGGGGGEGSSDQSPPAAAAVVSPRGAPTRPAPTLGGARTPAPLLETRSTPVVLRSGAGRGRGAPTEPAPPPPGSSAGSDDDAPTGAARAVHLKSLPPAAATSDPLFSSEKRSRRKAVRLDLNKADSLNALAASGDVRSLAQMLAGKADPNMRDMLLSTPLHHACTNGHTEVVLHLLKAKADPNLRNESGYTPLHSAAMKGHSGTVAALLDNAATEIDTQGEDGYTALHWACRMKRLEVGRALVLRGAALHKKNKEGSTPLQLAPPEFEAPLLDAFRELAGCMPSGTMRVNMGVRRKAPPADESTEDSGLCRICLDRPRRMLLMPCGHFHFCVECASSLKECPICRRAVESTVTVFG